MKRSPFTEEQVLFTLKRAEAGQSVGEVCRQMGIGEATFYVWKKRYSNLGILELRELRQLRDENAKLKRLVVDLTMDRHVLQEVIKKQFSGGSTPGDRAMGSRLRPTERGLFMSPGRLRRSVWYYRSKARLAACCLSWRPSA